MDHDDEGLAAGSIAIATILGAGGAMALPLVSGPWDASLRILSFGSVPVVVLASFLCGMVGGAIGLVVLTRNRRVSRGVVGMHVVVEAALVAVVMVGAQIVLSGVLPGGFLPRLAAVLVGVAVPALAVRGSRRGAPGGRGWSRPGGRLQDDPGY